MAGQLESRHFFRTGDTVQHWDGDLGEVVDGRPLYARISWEAGVEEEVDQFDPRIVVVTRAQGEG